MIEYLGDELLFSLVRYSEYVRITFHPQYEKKRSVDYFSQKQKSILRIESIVKHFSYRVTIFYSGVCYRVTVQTKQNETNQTKRKQNKTRQNKPNQTKPNHNRTNQNKPNQNKTKVFAHTIDHILPSFE